MACDVAALAVVAMCCDPVSFSSAACNGEYLITTHSYRYLKVDLHFVERVQCTQPCHLHKKSGSHVTLHNLRPDSQPSALTGALPRIRLCHRWVGGSHTRSDASPHICSPLIHSSCIPTLRNSAIVSTYQAPLDFQDPSETTHISVYSSSAGPMSNWAGHIELRRTPGGRTKIGRTKY